ncbi:MAG: alpha/beta hydrolase [Saprospiraceae bacterium]|nr:alpha/beta hydrolase [Saprospiraceae bacterium]
MKKSTILIALLLLGATVFESFTGNYHRTLPVHFKTVKVDGLDIFYREAGDPSKPTILLLHGFPSSSHMYRDLIDDLSANYHLVAPDYPGFGQSSMPGTEAYDYTFDNLALTVYHFTEALGLKKFSLYLQDYGGPVGFRIATQHPEQIQALIVQNANAYNEGLGDALKPLVAYIQDPNEVTVQPVKNFMTLSGTQWQYTVGAEDVSRINPDCYITDQYYLDRPGNLDIQLALVRNYGSNLPLYNVWQDYFRKYQPATLVISGKNDPLFTAPGAEAFKKDIKNAQISLLNGGHFVLEEKHQEAATLIEAFLAGKGIR